MSKHPEHPDAANRERLIERYLAAISFANQGEARRFCGLKHAQGKKANSRKHYALALENNEATSIGPQRR